MTVFGRRTVALAGAGAVLAAPWIAKAQANRLSVSRRSN